MTRIELAGQRHRVMLSPDGSRLYTYPTWNSERPRTLRIRDLRTRRIVATVPGVGEPVDLSPDGSTLATAESRDVVLMSASSGRRRRTLRGHGATVGDVVFSAGGRYLASRAEDDTAVVWDLRRHRVRERIRLGETAAHDVGLSGDGQSLHVAGDVGLRTYDVGGVDHFLPQLVPREHGAYVEGETYRVPSPQADAVAAYRDTGAGPDANYLLDPRTGWRLDLGDFETRDLAWRPDGARLAIVEPERLTVLARADARVVAVAKGDFGDFPSVAYTRDGRRLLVEGDRGLAMRDARTLAPTSRPLRGIRGRSISGAIPGPAGDTVVTLTADVPRSDFDFTTTQGWALVDLGIGEVLRDGALEPVDGRAALSPDGHRVAVGGGDAVQVIHLRTGSTRSPPRIAARTAAAGVHIAWSPDGAPIVSADNAGRVSLWDGHTGRLRGTVAPSQVPSSPVFEPDGMTVLIPAWDGSVYEWNTSTAHAIDVACDIVGRSLTRAEWAAVLPAQPYEPTCPRSRGDR